MYPSMHCKNEIITRTCFEEELKCLWTSESPEGDTNNMIDNITINKRFTNAVLCCKTCSNSE